MKFTAMKGRIDKLFEILEPKGSYLRIEGGLPDALPADSIERTAEAPSSNTGPSKPEVPVA
jgi:hypothetical protein